MDKFPAERRACNPPRLISVVFAPSPPLRREPRLGCAPRVGRRIGFSRFFMAAWPCASAENGSGGQFAAGAVGDEFLKRLGLAKRQSALFARKTIAGQCVWGPSPFPARDSASAARAPQKTIAGQWVWRETRPLGPPDASQRPPKPGPPRLARRAQNRFSAPAPGISLGLLPRMRFSPFPPAY